MVSLSPAVKTTVNNQLAKHALISILHFISRTAYELLVKKNYFLSVTATLHKEITF